MAIVINGSGTVTGISVGGLPDGIVDAGTLAVNSRGTVLQVVSVSKLTSFSTTSTSFVDVTGFSAAITPTSSSSKIFVQVSMSAGTNTASRITLFNLVRGSTTIGSPTSSGANSATKSVYTTHTETAHDCSFDYMDSPATTSSTTYKIQARINTGGTLYVGNRSVGDMEQISTITLMEIAG